MKIENPNLINKFQNSIQNKPVIGSVMKYHEIMGSDHYRSIIFVEGSSDKKFYVHTNIRELSVKSYYIYASQNEDYVGKEAVIESYQKIKADKCLADGLNKCIFIVDQDWDSMPEGVYITKWHSMENYFLQEDNLRKLFDATGKESEYQTFLDMYKKFGQETMDYWALKATVYYANKQGIKCVYRKKYDFNDIFCFKYADNHTIRYEKKLMDEETHEMHNAILGAKKLTSFYKGYAKKIKNNINFVRGHEAFRFLQCYFLGRFGINIDLFLNNKMITESINKFKVELISEKGILE